MADDIPIPIPSPLDTARLTLLGHDLRAAVSDVIGGLRLIDQSRVDDAARLQLERVRASGETLSRLLEEGLALILGEDDFAATHPAILQMPRFLYDLEMRWSGRASEKGLTFALTRDPAVPEVLTLDRMALERTLSNILSNAIKYTDAGSVRLDVTMAKSGALRLAITDEGPGFSAAALSRLFEFQGRPDGTGKPGDGLGMHITRNMAGRLGGTISVENLQRGGACVTLDLPPETWTIAAPEPVGALPDLSRTKVLVAEDNATNQQIIAHMLGKMSAQYEIAEDGVEALRWLERERFDLALIDIEMPRLNGIEVIRAIRTARRSDTAMPIVAITAYVLKSNRDAIFLAGADAILAKPLAGLDAFGAVLAQALDGTTTPAETPETAGAEIDRASLDHLLDIAGPDGARELLDRLHADLLTCERGLTAGLAGGDTAAIRSDTHVLIALAGAIGAHGLQALSQTLNHAAHRGEIAGAGALGAEVLTRLSALIALVADERSVRGAST